MGELLGVHFANGVLKQVQHDLYFLPFSACSDGTPRRSYCKEPITPLLELSP